MDQKENLTQLIYILNKHYNVNSKKEKLLEQAFGSDSYICLSDPIIDDMLNYIENIFNINEVSMDKIIDLVFNNELTQEIISKKLSKILI